MVEQPKSIDEQERIKVSVKQILKYAWGQYVKTHKVRPIEAKEVEKAINCYNRRGPFVYFCETCQEYIFQKLGCNSRICSCCGKRYADQWAYSLSKAMFKVPHRHFVMSIPDLLWPFLMEDRSLWKVYMDSAIKACEDYFPKLMRKHKARVGVIVILHPFGKDMRFQPHLHLIITEGGFDRNGNFIKQEFIPARKFAIVWQYHVLTMLQKHGLPNHIATILFKKYKGFYVWVHKDGRIHHPKLIAKYLGRYVRHPAIANSRITSFDGENVRFYYEDNDKKQHDVVMSVSEFISSLIQHIPEPQFKMIRYYGAYARRTKCKFGKFLQLMQSGIKQASLYIFGFRTKPKCPNCGGDLEFVWYCEKPPPEELETQQELKDWLDREIKLCR